METIRLLSFCRKKYNIWNYFIFIYYIFFYVIFLLQLKEKHNFRLNIWCRQEARIFLKLKLIVFFKKYIHLKAQNCKIILQLHQNYAMLGYLSLHRFEDQKQISKEKTLSLLKTTEFIFYGLTKDIN